MARLRPVPSKTATPPKSILKRKDAQSPTTSRSESLFATTKKDKRRIKSAQLQSKVTKSSPTKPRRRRPNKKLVANLDALADALPDNEDGDSAEGSDSAKASGVAGSKPAEQVNIIKRKSMKSRPGAMKRKQKLDNSERDRFAKNLAQMAAPNLETEPGSESIGGSIEKLRALRGFISQTLEKKPEVASAKG